MGKPGTTPALTRGDAHKAIQRFGVSPRTHAYPVLPPDADDATWMDARRRGLGASETAGIMGLSPHSSEFSVWWHKVSGVDIDANDAMRIGSKLEPVIGELFEEDHPGMVFRPGARLWRHPSPDCAFMLATPDFLVVDPDLPRFPIPLECKSDEGGAWGTPGTGDVPIHHKIQVTQQMAVMGAPRGYLYRLAGKRTSLYRIEWDDATSRMWSSMVEHGRTFMAMVESGVAPDIDGHEATSTALTQMYPAVDKDTETTIPDAIVVAYRDALAAEGHAKAEKRRLANEIRARMARHEYAVDPDGFRVAQRRVYKRRGYEVAPAMVDSINPINPKPYV